MCKIEETNKNALTQERIDNGDIYFPSCKNKGECQDCGAVIDKGNDNYCWRCGAKLN